MSPRTGTGTWTWPYGGSFPKMFNWHLNTAARTENRGAITASTNATTITAAASANTKGSYADIGAVTSFDYEAVSLMFGNSSAAADFVFDLSINVGGNRFIIADDLRHCDVKDGHWAQYHMLPIHVPAGSQLSIRCASSVLSTTLDILIVGHSSSLFGGPGYSRCIALYTPSSSRGINCDPGATNNTKTRTQITASTPQRVVALMVGSGGGGDASRSAVHRWLFDIEQGGAGSEQVIIPNIYQGCNSTGDLPTQTVLGPFPCDIAAGTRLSCNIQDSNNTSGDRVLDIALHGFVP